MWFASQAFHTNYKHRHPTLFRDTKVEKQDPHVELSLSRSEKPPSGTTGFFLGVPDFLNPKSPST
jgi:hypothetical protein